MLRSQIVILGLALFGACGSPDAPEPIADVTSDLLGDLSEVSVDVASDFIPPTEWSPGVELLEVVDSLELQGSLSDGAPVDLAWAYDLNSYCFNVVEASAYFGGALVFYALAKPMPKLSSLTVELTPEPGVDLNLFAYQLGPTEYFVPPNVPETDFCQASFDDSVQANPGVSESLFLTATGQAHNVLIGVGASEGTLEGSYTLRLVLEGGIPSP